MTKIFLNGVLLQHCVSYDIEKGIATCYVLNGSTYVLDASGDALLTEDKFGEVSIERDAS